jgi:hypothetical protein
MADRLQQGGSVRATVDAALCALLVSSTLFLSHASAAQGGDLPYQQAVVAHGTLGRAHLSTPSRCRRQVEHISMPAAVAAAANSSRTTRLC